jgi:hypothetical protein
MEASLDMVSIEDVWSGFEDLGWRTRSVGPVLSISVGSCVPHHILSSSAGGGRSLARTQKEELGRDWA